MGPKRRRVKHLAPKHVGARGYTFTVAGYRIYTVGVTVDSLIHAGFAGSEK